MTTILSHMPGACAKYPLGNPTMMGPGPDRVAASIAAMAVESKTKYGKEPIVIVKPSAPPMRADDVKGMNFQMGKLSIDEEAFRQRERERVIAAQQRHLLEVSPPAGMDGYFDGDYKSGK